MFALLAAVFIVFSFLEIYVLVLVGQSIGALNTLGLVILIALVGAWLDRRARGETLRAFFDRTTDEELGLLVGREPARSRREEAAAA